MEPVTVKSTAVLSVALVRVRLPAIDEVAASASEPFEMLRAD
jgi:hypothetical protein